MTAKFSQLETPKKKTEPLRKAITLALAAAALGTLLPGAGRLSDWARSFLQTPHTTIEDQKEAEIFRLSYKHDSIAVTSDGTTVTLRQYLADSHPLLLSFRVEGVEVPEKEHPMFTVNTFTFDGKRLRKNGSSQKYLRAYPS